ncbi:hypothetical protein DPMN_168315 [Dreissena polymorpha]|uniref:Uncharacterized protein n=1 Tax=Dreissena polymorpha TaxID=45954 RepID=A0A9D4F0E9_DREPO|nr:hypothetical protein DPMN_168315 [Dreissena polymorpha]
MFSHTGDSSENEKSESPLLGSVPGYACEAFNELDTLLVAASRETAESFLSVDKDIIQDLYYKSQTCRSCLRQVCEHTVKGSNVYNV